MANWPLGLGYSFGVIWTASARDRPVLEVRCESHTATPDAMNQCVAETPLGYRLARRALQTSRRAVLGLSNAACEVLARAGGRRIDHDLHAEPRSRACSRRLERHRRCSRDRRQADLVVGRAPARSARARPLGTSDTCQLSCASSVVSMLSLAPRAPAPREPPPELDRPRGRPPGDLPGRYRVPPETEEDDKSRGQEDPRSRSRRHGPGEEVRCQRRGPDGLGSAKKPRSRSAMPSSSSRPGTR